MRSEVIQKRAIVEVMVDYQYDDNLPGDEPHVVKYGNVLVSGRTYDDAITKLQAALRPPSGDERE